MSECLYQSYLHSEPTARQGNHFAVPVVRQVIEGEYATKLNSRAFDRRPLSQTLHSRNHLDWMRELEARLKMKNVNHNIMSIAIAKNVLLENIMELADREVDGTATCKPSSSVCASKMS